MTQSEFENLYASSVGLAPNDPALHATLIEQGYCAVECDCGELNCRGWRMDMDPRAEAAYCSYLRELARVMEAAATSVGAKSAREREARTIKALVGDLSLPEPLVSGEPSNANFASVSEASGKPPRTPVMGRNATILVGEGGIFKELTFSKMVGIKVELPPGPEEPRSEKPAVRHMRRMTKGLQASVAYKQQTRNAGTTATRNGR